MGFRGVKITGVLADGAKTSACERMDAQTKHNLIEEKPSYRILGPFCDRRTHRRKKPLLIEDIQSSIQGCKNIVFNYHN